jgi:hypothetical protein
MKKTTILTAFDVAIVFLLIISPVLFIWYTPYVISWDRHYVNTVNERALMQGYNSENSIVDLSSIVVANNDIVGRFERKVWKLDNQFIYYREQFFYGVLLSIFLAGVTFLIKLWADGSIKDDDEDMTYY